MATTPSKLFPLSSFAFPQKGQKPTRPLSKPPERDGQFITPRFTVSPAQIVESLAVMVASFNVTLIESLALQPPWVTVHEYVPFAVTVVVLVVPPLLHKYESYPEGAVNVVVVPHTVTSAPKPITGLFTTTVTESVHETPFVVTVQV